MSGPQTGYFFPQVLLEIDLHGGGLDARGITFAGIPYVAIGRAKDYAWSATSGGSDLADQRILSLCNADGSPPTRRSVGYRFRGRCRPMEVSNLGRLTVGGTTTDVIRKRTAYGTVSATATVRGRPVAVATAELGHRPRGAVRARPRRPQREQGPQLEGLRARDEPDGVQLQLELRGQPRIALFHSGRYPRRARGVDPDLPSWGDGRWDWRGFISRKAHPQTINPRGGLLLSWNNKPAPGWRSADGNYAYGSVYRVDLLTAAVRKRRRHSLTSLTAAMNYAATQDLRGTTPLRRALQVLKTRGPAIPARERRMLALLGGLAQGRRAAAGPGARREDRRRRRSDPGRWWDRLTDAIFGPRLGTEGLAALERIQQKDNEAANDFGSAYQDGWYGYVEKDLRRVLGRKVKSPFSRRYCGRGSLGACRGSLLSSLRATGDVLQAAQGADPAAWRSSAEPERIAFQPGLLGRTMRWTNRPTFQQLMEFSGHRPR